jgi:NAD(P)-dependent dehydrogenase (short-subunit alcohol dehydrogenase family)
MRLVLLDVQAEPLAQVVTELRQGGAEVLPFELSVADAPAMQAMAQAVQAQWGAPHLVFNNASKRACSTVVGASFCHAKPCKSHPAYATRRAILHLPCLEKSNTRLALLVIAAATRCMH